MDRKPSFQELEQRVLKLENQEKGFLLLFDRMKLGYALHEIIVNENGKPVDYVFLEVNRAFETLTGLHRDDVLHKKVTEVLPDIEKDPADWIGKYGRVALAGRELTFAHYSQPLGKWYSVQAVRLEKGRFVTVFEDITDKRRTEETLRREKEKFRTLLENIVDWVWMVDASGRYTYVSPQAKDVLGYDVDEILGRTPFDFMASDEVQSVAPIFSEAVEKRQRISGLEDALLAKDGSTVIFETNATPLFGEKGDLSGFMGTCRDITERKKAETKLIESESRFRSFVENANDIVYSLSPEGRFTYVSPNWPDFMGEAAAEAIGKSFEPYVHPEDVPLCRRFLERILATGDKQSNVEYRVQHRDGSWRWHVSNGSPIRNSEKNIIEYLGIARDVTADRQLQEEIRQRNSELAALNAIGTMVNQSLDLEMVLADALRKTMSILNAQGGLVYLFDEVGGTVTPASHQGISPDMLRELSGFGWGQGLSGRVAETGEPLVTDLGKDARNVSSASVREGFRSYAGIPITSKGKILGVMSLVARREKAFTAQHLRLLIPIGNQIGIALENARLYEQARRDLADRKAAEHDRERLLHAIEQAAEVVVITTPDGAIQYVNKAFEHVTGYTAEEVRGQNPRILKSGRQSAGFYRELWQTITSGRTWQGRFVNRRKDGSLYTEEASISPVTDATGRINNFVAVKRDITAEIELKARLVQAQKMESIGNLAGGIAHDFNNILFPIIGMSELLMEDLPAGSLERENAQEILNAGLRGSDLVKQILAFSRQSEHRMIPVKPQQVFKEAVKLMRSTLPANIEINQYLETECGMVLADPSQIHQVAMNLITNAYHAVEQTDGKISVTLEETDLKAGDLPDGSLEPGRYALLIVSDTGIGIDPVVMDMIFEPYFTTKEKGKGTGLGLAVVFGIVKEHGGAVTVESEIKKGTTFKVYLPLMDRTAAPISDERTNSHPTGTECILLVDDERSVVVLEKQILERLGYHVTECMSSVEALNSFKADPSAFDLVVSDMTMPHMTGDQLAAELMAVRPDIPVIICTGFSERLNKDKAAALGIKGFLMKPVIKSEMARMVRTVLDAAEGKRP